MTSTQGGPASSCWPPPYASAMTKRTLAFRLHALLLIVFVLLLSSRFTCLPVDEWPGLLHMQAGATLQPGLYG